MLLLQYLTEDINIPWYVMNKGGDDAESPGIHWGLLGENERIKSFRLL